MSSQQVVNLQVRSGSQRGERFSFAGPATVRVGRSERVEVRLPGDPNVADVHLQLKISPDGCLLQTFAQQPDVLLNGKAVRKSSLQHGDVLRVGSTELEFLIGESRSVVAGSHFNDATVLLPTTPLEGNSRRKNVAPDVFPIQVPGFTASRFVGRGGMGAVYEAVRQSNGEKVAIKILNSLQAVGKDLQLFLREASVLSSLNHPRIVTFREVGWAEGQVFIVMEYIQCIDLQKLFKQASPTSRIRLASGIIGQVLQALDYAHRRRIVHRDIKPSNILVTRSEGRLQTKLSDFGLAKNFESAGYSAMTGDGEARGTLSYMSPEQLENSRYAKPAADIYSTGVTLFYFLSGELPFSFLSTQEQRAAALKAVPESLRRQLPDVPAELSRLVAKSMATDPDARFASAAEMREALVPFAKAPTN